MTSQDSRREYNFGTDDLLATYYDENRSVLNYVYDPLGRRTHLGILLAPGVIGTSAQNFQYDGLGRMTRAMNTVPSHGTTNVFYYDSIGRMVEDSVSISTGPSTGQGNETVPDTVS